ncbi:MAG: hypothetical protein ACD_70C00114G0007 [uncultured bacterium]|nr:MAG: hypothetical protein ACD_70C00114G0007 [uncultured bacterium]OGT25542.1 MAG: hypothetical protein A3B71_05765 [Gammaproteobacteria bacterium RIFCSPHIGHO2_02_FULL_42_43]OGT51496.1 MAG: hypothetical protein A3E54_05530 [Gammaproteobacteria bacterium RIFCSPHIGHO2_12_FULL_41_25]OGT62197.1 MAG: hypothetical protein A3I77_04465 [Gammaproteobacteria bacterium RIFCSPLOWO2_02_FULL_42_14]OGT85870.1 MAG: hypothetical protein A3G86_04155 [Gammaproteobacteria bacterium RIFCSPLOWO2_12_FULL_42_18]
MQRDLIKTAILEWQTPHVIAPNVQRKLFVNLDAMIRSELIVIITGVRRCGKSILLQHIRQQKKENHYYLNFEDERLVHFTVDDFQMMMEIFIELFGEAKTCYFDEIQNILGWERFVRRLHEQGYKIFVTGSNAKMLSQELGTHLTGRYVKIELYPFSFTEFLAYKNIAQNTSHAITAVKAKLNGAMKKYIQLGGFPQYLKEELLEYLQSLYESILYRDIVSRYRLPNDQIIRELVFYLASNVGKEMTFNALRKQLHLGAVNTVSEYCQYLENCFLFFLVKRFSHSIKVQSHSPKKIYAVDTGLARAIGFRSSDDFGRMLENIIYIELKRRGFEIYFHREKKECDFVVCKQNKIKMLIQVCLDIDDSVTRAREIDGLMDAMSHHHMTQGIIITLSDSETVHVEIQNKRCHIEIIPVWRWLTTE